MTYRERHDHEEPSIKEFDPIRTQRRSVDARITDACERRAHELVKEHVDEHSDEDERVRPRAVRDELLHDGTLPPALMNGRKKLPDRK